MDKNCYSCGMPLMSEGPQKARGNFCQYCSDEQGNLLPREQVQNGIAQWLSTWAPKDSNSDYLKRAEYYMKAMPAWTDV
jgi:hypothetical protein